MNLLIPLNFHGNNLKESFNQKTRSSSFFIKKKIINLEIILTIRNEENQIFNNESTFRYNIPLENLVKGFSIEINKPKKYFNILNEIIPYDFKDITLNMKPKKLYNKLGINLFGIIELLNKDIHKNIEIYLGYIEDTNKNYDLNEDSVFITHESTNLINYKNMSLCKLDFPNQFSLLKNFYNNSNYSDIDISFLNGTIAQLQKKGIIYEHIKMNSNYFQINLELYYYRIYPNFDTKLVNDELNKKYYFYKNIKNMLKRNSFIFYRLYSNYYFKEFLSEYMNIFFESENINKNKKTNNSSNKPNEYQSIFNQLTKKLKRKFPFSFLYLDFHDSRIPIKLWEYLISNNLGIKNFNNLKPYDYSLFSIKRIISFLPSRIIQDFINGVDYNQITNYIYYENNNNDDENVIITIILKQILDNGYNNLQYDNISIKKLVIEYYNNVFDEIFKEFDYKSDTHENNKKIQIINGRIFQNSLNNDKKILDIIKNNFSGINSLLFLWNIQIIFITHLYPRYKLDCNDNFHFQLLELSKFNELNRDYCFQLDDIFETYIYKFFILNFMKIKKESVNHENIIKIELFKMINIIDSFHSNNDEDSQLLLYKNSENNNNNNNNSILIYNMFYKKMQSTFFIHKDKLVEILKKIMNEKWKLDKSKKRRNYFQNFGLKGYIKKKFVSITVYKEEKKNIEVVVDSEEEYKKIIEKNFIENNNFSEFDMKIFIDNLKVINENNNQMDDYDGKEFNTIRKIDDNNILFDSVIYNSFIIIPRIILDIQNKIIKFNYIDIPYLNLICTEKERKDIDIGLNTKFNENNLYKMNLTMNNKIFKSKNFTCYTELYNDSSNNSKIITRFQFQFNKFITFEYD
jgi:hypothetical protein